MGIRGIDFIGEFYEAIGEIVSTNYTAAEELKKLAVIANKLVTPGLTNIRHYISVDDGQNWNQIQSVEKMSQDVTEILNYNLEVLHLSKVAYQTTL